MNFLCCTGPDLTNSILLPAVLMLTAPFVGSFVGVLIMRLPSDRPVVFGRSYCETCDHAISIGDMVPLVSAICLKFRCRYCRTEIDHVRAFAEITALVIAIWAASVTSGWLLVMSCMLGWLLLALAIIDWRFFLLPNVLTISLLTTGFVATSMLNPGTLVDHFIGAIVGFVLLAGLGSLYRLFRARDGLGLGDAKLLGAIGAWVSLDSVPSVLVLAAVTGLIVALGLSVRSREFELTMKVPFGTCLAAAGWLVWLYGPLNFGQI